MKSELLKILSANSDKVYSGEALSQQLGISRVSIWKHIKKLKELGYSIAATSNGYQLECSPDALYPWEFPEREHLIRYHQEVTSTMEVAKEEARGGCEDFTVIIAESQSNGRGRLKRRWHSDSGGLYFTLVLRPKVPPIMMTKFSFAASFSLVSVLRDEFQIDAKAKWPNDILVNERKLSGMLCEMEMESDMVSFVNIGIGLNVNNNPSEYEPNAVSIKELIGKPVPRRRILSLFLDRLKDEIDSEDLDGIIPRWKQHAITLNRQVKIVTTTEQYEGFATDIDENGALLLKQPDSSIKKVYYGDCFHMAV